MHDFALHQTRIRFPYRMQQNTLRIKIIFPHYFNNDITALNTKWFHFTSVTTASFMNANSSASMITAH